MELSTATSEHDGISLACRLAPVVAGPRPVREIQPGFRLFVYLQGWQRFEIDGQRFDISADGGPVALALALTRPARLAQLAWSEDRMGKLMITAPRDWTSALDLKGAGHGDALATFLAGHGNNHLWRLDDDSIRLARLAAEPPAWVPREALPLYRRARAFDLICLTLSTLALRREESTLPRPALSLLGERIRVFLLDHLNEPLTIDAVAQAVGASVSVVQRCFKELYGMTVFDFVRRRRLDAARDALDNRGVSIACAAFIAGYSAPSSFATAFKKAYGVPPKLRRRQAMPFREAAE
ncbi:AraC family transcriptional regulator [Pleomorphomonas diazotrophica]|uniref:AraC family transcriptional regulator n=1 Tax=Pleomorphomonas diazotrophica TaxID=1166257 RepID=A0A1I4TGT0_9HYPH|nr:AraC family transcriptional regulator [Pleomorphomonas diazotrophica]PKR87246.1 AraC family transcriptional regulator [Pleomorphomonas diazotrophica]SFM75899.1 AraC-type DNA-binding protein [Pleomorphomonas diazotrophica]